MGVDTDALERGRSCYAGRAWLDAFDALTAADRAASLGPDELELLARSAYMLGRDDDYLHGLQRAHHAYLNAGEPARAARCAFWIGHNLLFRGQLPRATGWFGRAQRLLGRVDDDCVERGYLLIPLWLEQMDRGDWSAGHASAVQAAQIAERFGDADLFWLSADEQARALLNLRRVDEGLRLVDEVMVAASAGECSPVVTGILYCNTIAFCHGAFALRHAGEWTQALTSWCDRQPQMIAHNGLCLVHRAEIMQLRGEWSEALREAAKVADRFSLGALNQIACGRAQYVQGEIHRLRGELREAHAAYREASRLGFEPQPGLAMLRLADGDAEAAAATLRRALGESVDPLQRARLLPAYVEIQLALDDVEEARGACQELTRLAESQAQEVLVAIAARACGMVALAQAEPGEALPWLRSALAVWQHLEAPYEAARLRVLIGLGCRALGDKDGADLEREAAHDTYVRLGAAPDVDRLAGLLPPDLPGGTRDLTARELDVLRLAAEGKRNRDIAADLVLSEHTVARHLQNIFAKLGVSSRTAATAYAFQHHLV